VYTIKKVLYEIKQLYHIILKIKVKTFNKISVLGQLRKWQWATVTV